MQLKAIHILAFFCSIFLMTKLFANENNASRYQIIFKLPVSTPYKVALHQESSSEYIFDYVPVSSKTANQNIIITYHKRIWATTQQFANALNKRNIDCQTKKINIIKQQKNIFFMTALFDQCLNRAPLKGIFKIFNMPDGQYMIMASIHNLNSDKTMPNIEMLVKSAKIIPRFN